MIPDWNLFDEDCDGWHAELGSGVEALVSRAVDSWICFIVLEDGAKQIGRGSGAGPREAFAAAASEVRSISVALVSVFG